MPHNRHTKRFGVFIAALVLAACSKQGAAPAGSMQMPPPQVNVIELKAGEVALNEQLPGRLEASRIAEVRARVSGIVEKRLFVEGSDVKAGDLLFQIDDAPYRAKLAAAKAQQAKAEAALAEASYQAERIKSLEQQKAVSEFDLIKANAQLEQAKAQLEAAKAEVVSAGIDLDYTKVKSPIDGRIGRGFVTEGALVSPTAATLMATVQQTQTMYVNVQQSSELLLQRYRANEKGELALLEGDEAVQVEIVLPDGKAYPHKGKLLFSDINVDRGTGQLMLRAEIPNPNGVLMPGLFVKVNLHQASYTNAFLVPQRAVSRSSKGDTVMIVDKENILNVRPVTVAGSVEGKWLITQGVEQGEKLMVDGFQKARPGAPVAPVSVDAAQNP